MEQETLHFEKRVIVLTSRDYSNLAAMHEALASLEEVIQVKSLYTTFTRACRSLGRTLGTCGCGN